MKLHTWQRAPLILLVLVNIAVTLFVVTDVRRRLQVVEIPHGAAETRLSSTPTMVPAPTFRPAAAPSVLPSASPLPPTAAPTWPPGSFPATLVSDERFSCADDFYAGEVQSFLETQGSGLAEIVLVVGEGTDSFAHVLSGHCIRYGLNPKVVLTLLEVQSGVVRQADLSSEQLDWVFGYRNQQWRGLELQLQWAVFVLADSFRGEEVDELPLLTDDTLAPIPGEANAATRSLLRLLAYTADRDHFYRLRSEGEGSFVGTYRDLFGEDPRLPLTTSWEPTRQPFLGKPFYGEPWISSYFDHEYPIFRENGSLLPYSGNRGAHSYDGHDGWDYVLSAGEPILAAAAGRVVFAGMLDTLCPTPAGLVVVDHGQGYRTLYWHLQRVDVREGVNVDQGERLGTVGSTGCSTGPHLHFGVQFMGRDTDPYGWCGSEEVPVDPWALHPAGVVSRWLWADQPSPCPVPAAAVVVDDQSADFAQSPALWYEAPVGYAGHSFWAYAVDDMQRSTHRAVWRPDLSQAGRYFLYAYVPWYDTDRPDTGQARYRIHHANGDATVTVDQAHAAGLWVPLGSFNFAQGSRGYVYLDEVTGDEGRTVWFDVIVWVEEVGQ